MTRPRPAGPPCATCSSPKLSDRGTFCRRCSARLNGARGDHPRGPTIPCPLCLGAKSRRANLCRRCCASSGRVLTMDQARSVRLSPLTDTELSRLLGTWPNVVRQVRLGLTYREVLE